jgi:valyl-tRNA synthetase
VIADEMVDPKFGTGVVKITPAHDENDWQVAQRHNLPLIQVIGFNGRMTEEAGQKYAGMKTAQAREEILNELSELGVLEKEKEYTHRVGVCYKSGDIIEPLPLEQWFINIKPLAQAAIKRIQNDEITFYPKKYKRLALQILENYHDWNISRQIVWGIRIPAFRHKKTGEWKVEIDPVAQQKLIATGQYEQDQDTFDTWFSSGQWPFATLQSLGSDKNGESYFNYFYPTSVMETGHDILRAWVARMIMLGEYMTGTVPFTHVFLHGMVRDKHGQKMSKSKGNVVNPIEFMDKYGADALRAALIFGTKDGGDTNISEEKTIGMRNFANKIWNIGRFIWLTENPSADAPPFEKPETDPKTTAKVIKEMEKEFAVTLKTYRKHMDKDQYSKAFDLCYRVMWHRFADYYIEALKDEMRSGNTEVLSILKKVYFGLLVMLSPFIPYVTEAVWQVFHGKDTSIMQSELLR